MKQKERNVFVVELKVSSLLKTDEINMILDIRIRNDLILTTKCKS